MAEKKEPMRVVRLDDNQFPDDIVFENVNIHLERMSHNIWWLGIYDSVTDSLRERVCLWLQSGDDINVSIGEQTLDFSLERRERYKE